MAATMTQLDADEDPELDRRGLTEFMAVLSDVGRARDDDSLYLVVSQSGEYLVDPDQPECTCPDHRHRGRRCKHVRRTRFALGWRPIPNYVDESHVDDQLGMHVDDVDDGGGGADGA